MKFVYMRTTCSVTILNMRLKQNWTYWSNKYLFFCLYIICVEYEYEAFNASSDEIRLMAFYLYPDFIDVSLKIWLSSSDEIRIITNVFWLNCTEHELKTWLSPMDGSLAITHLSVTKKAWKNLTQSDENCVLSLTPLIRSDYSSKHNLHIILEFGSFLATYSLSVQYLISKHDSR